MRRIWIVVLATVAVTVVACSGPAETREQREQAVIAEATQLVAEKKFSEARVRLSSVTDSAQISDLLTQATEGQRQQEAERLVKVALEAVASIQSDLDALGASDVASIDGVSRTLVTFQRAESFLNSNSSSSFDDAGKALRASVRSSLARKQSSLFPLMRSTYAKDLAQTFWENDVEVIVSGSGNRKIRFIAAMFAANRNIASGQQAGGPMLRKLRFSRSQYEWYRGSEYTFYDLNPGPDSQVPD